MSQYGIVYQLEFKNVEGFIIRVNISPTDILIPDIDTQQIIPLKGGATPLVISASDNEEDKLNPIRSKSAKITFRSDSSNGLDSSTFSMGGDDLWVVDIFLLDTPEYIFRGFLMLADNQQPFQPDPNYVTLTATDHLGALKEVPLVDDAGLNPIGKYRVAELLAFCLAKTGLSLNIKVVNNLRAGGGQFTMAATITGTNTITVADTSMFYIGQRLEITTTAGTGSVFVLTKTSTVITIDGSMVNVVDPAAVFLDYNSQFHWYDVVYLDAKTFEREIGESEDCYTVLNKILGEDCFITQWLGEWWIFRVDEMEGNPVYVATFNAAGTYVSTAAGTQYDKSIGFIEDSKFANADTLLRFIRPHGWIRETFNYDTPLETPCNVNFERGDEFSVVSTTEIWYDIDCWTKRRGLPGAYNTPITITDYIVRIFNGNNYETDRYILITPQTGHSGFSSTDDEYIESEAIPVQVKDKFVASINWRLGADIASSSASPRMFRMILEGDDGTWWILGESTVGDGIPVWYNTLLWTVNTGKGATGIIFADQEETQWQSISWTAPPVPVSGNIYIWVNQFYQSSTTGVNTTVYYSNLRFEYIPYINGSYARYSGQSSRIDRLLDGYMAKRDNTVYISDSPTKLYKGSMFLLVNGAYILFPVWFAAAPNGNNYPPTMDYLHPYGYIQAYSVWNQYKGVNDPTTGRGVGINIFAGSVKGLTDDWPDLLHRYTLTDTNIQTVSRYFILISLEQDWKTCIWTAVFIEVAETVVFKTYNDPLEFKYISE